MRGERADESRTEKNETKRNPAVSFSPVSPTLLSFHPYSARFYSYSSLLTSVCSDEDGHGVDSDGSHSGGQMA